MHPCTEAADVTELLDDVDQGTKTEIERVPLIDPENAGRSPPISAGWIPVQVLPIRMQYSTAKKSCLIFLPALDPRL